MNEKTQNINCPCLTIASCPLMVVLESDYSFFVSKPQVKNIEHYLCTAVKRFGHSLSNNGLAPENWSISYEKFRGQVNPQTQSERIATRTDPNKCMAPLDLAKFWTSPATAKDHLQKLHLIFLT